MWDLKIESIRFLPDYIIEIKLSENIIIEYDMKANLNKARFSALKDEEFFKSGKLKDNCFIQWDCLTFIYDYEMFSYNLRK